MANVSVNLQEEIILLRQKLDSLLDNKPVSCMEVQEISIKLDELIVKYYSQDKSYSMQSC